MLRVATLLALIALCAPGGSAAADGMRVDPSYHSWPGAGEGVEPFYRSYCPPDLATYGGCPVRVYSGSYGSFWSAPSPLRLPSAPARSEPGQSMPVRKD